VTGCRWEVSGIGERSPILERPKRGDIGPAIGSTQVAQTHLSPIPETSNGIPSHDTFGRVFSRLDPAALLACIRNCSRLFAKRLPQELGQDQASDPEVVAIDGKTLRGLVRHRRQPESAALGQRLGHRCSAGAGSGGGRRQVQRNHCESPLLLELLDLKGCIVTIDAMGMSEGDCDCHPRTGSRLRVDGQGQSADVAPNRGRLFLGPCRDRLHRANAAAAQNGRPQTTAAKETREYFVAPTPAELTRLEEWKDLRSVWPGDSKTPGRR